MTYTLLASGVVGESGPTFASPNTNPFGNAATAILSDGSFFVANWVEDMRPGVLDYGVLRLWRLDKTMVELGRADITWPVPAAGTENVPHPYAIGIGGMKVLLIRSLYRSVGTIYGTFIVDCSGDVPVVGPEVSFSGVNQPTYGGSDSPISIYDQGTDRVLVACYNLLQVFRGSTGALLSEHIPGATRSNIGLHMDPADHTKFTLSTDRSQYLFTIALDGLTGSYDGAPVGYTTSDWIVAATSPYVKSGLIVEVSGSPMSSTHYEDLAGVDLVPPSPESTDGYTEMWQGWSSLGARQEHALYYFEMSHNGVVGPYYENSNEGRLVTIDNSEPTPVMEVLALPYFGVPPVATVTLSAGSTTISADPVSGLILIATTLLSRVYDYSVALGGTQQYPTNSLYTTLAWAIQGPSNMPNLTGQLLGDRVRFT